MSWLNLSILAGAYGRVRVVSVGLCVVVVCAVGLVAPAGVLGEQLHVAAGPGFSGPGLSLVATGLSDGGSPGSGVAVDEATGDVYVADTGDHRVVEFTASGVFVLTFGREVNKTEVEAHGSEAAQDVCTAASGDVCQVGVVGSAPGAFESPSFVAVDNSGDASEGDVYVADTGDSLVSKFTSEGALVEGWGVKGQLDGGSAPGGPFGPLAGVGVDPSGDLWVYVGSGEHAPNNHMYEFEASGTFHEKWGGAIEESAYSPEGVAVDCPDDLYVAADASAVLKLKCDGELLGTVAEMPVTGLAVDMAHKDLYVDEGGLVDDFSSQCEPLLTPCVPVLSFGGGAGELQAGAGVAVDAATGTVFVANTGADEVLAFRVALEATVAPADGVGALTARLGGRVDPEGSELTRCVFEYGETTGYGKVAECEESPASIGEGVLPVEVHAPVSGLIGSTHYHYRLRVRNAAGEVESEDGELVTSPAAVIEEAQAEQLEEAGGTVSATLTAKINPEGLAATYHFEYDTRPYETGEAPHGTPVPAVGQAIGAGSTGVAVSQALGGLAPEQTYYFRVVVSDANATVYGPDTTFVYLPREPVEIQHECANEAVRGESNPDPATGVALSRYLPDCRAYEMVTPPEKNAALIGYVLFGLHPQFAEDGERVIASSVQCFDDPPSCTGVRKSEGPPFAFERTPGGWVTQPLALPGSEFSSSSAEGYDANTGMVLYAAPVAGKVPDELFAREAGGGLLDIGPTAKQAASVLRTGFAVASGELSHVVYQAGAVLWPELTPITDTIYEYAGPAGKPFVVNVNGGENSTEEIEGCPAAIGASDSSALYYAVSKDGRIVYFTICDDAVYARVDGEAPDAHTVAISAPAAGTGSGPDECDHECREDAGGDAFLEGVSEDGSISLFTSTGRLTNDAGKDNNPHDTAEANGCVSTTGVNGCNLYLSDLDAPAGERLVDISVGDSSGLGPEVQGMMAVSADGSHVYFVAKGILVSGVNREGKAPVEGEDNLYSYERNPEFPAGRVTFVATLPGNTTPVAGEHPESEQWKERRELVANVSPSGGILVFTSHGALTGDDPRGVGPAQVYRYDAEDESLLRVSVGERGYDDDGNAAAGGARIVPPLGNVGQPRRDPTMSDDGSRVFFQSPAGLTPGALNNVRVNTRGEDYDFAQNVYEWEADGTGACTLAGGCVFLISDGRDMTEGTSTGATESTVELLYVDATGENVFFTTVDPLVAQDTDSELDYYDARVGGGFPRHVTPVECVSDGCHEDGRSVPGVLGGLQSQVFGGEGNFVSKLGGPPAPPKLTRAELLAKALKVCRAKHDRGKRVACEREARRKYTPKPKVKAKAKGRAKGKHASVSRSSVGRAGVRGVGVGKVGGG